MQKTVAIILFGISVVLLVFAVRHLALSNNTQPKTEISQLQQELDELKQQNQGLSKQLEQELPAEPDLARQQSPVNNQSKVETIADENSAEYQALLEEAREQIAAENKLKPQFRSGPARQSPEQQANQDELIAMGIRNQYEPILRELGLGDDAIEALLTDLIEASKYSMTLFRKKVAGEITEEEYRQQLASSYTSGSPLDAHLNPEQQQELQQRLQEHYQHQEELRIDALIERRAGSLSADTKQLLSRKLAEIYTDDLRRDLQNPSTSSDHAMRYRKQLAALDELETSLAAQLDHQEMLVVKAFFNTQRQEIKLNLALNEAM